MNDQRKRTVIDGRGRDIILKVHKYFENERDECKELLKRLTTLFEYEKAVKVPLELFTDVINYLKSTSQVTKRVAAATGINKNSLTKIKEEAAVAKANNTNLTTPVKKPRGKKFSFNTAEYEQLGDIIKANFTKEQDFKFNKLMPIVRRDLNYQGSKATLRRIIWDMGYRWKKHPGSTRVTLTECGHSGEKSSDNEYSRLEVNQSKNKLKDENAEESSHDHKEEIEVLEEFDVLDCGDEVNNIKPERCKTEEDISASVTGNSDQFLDIELSSHHFIEEEYLDLDTAYSEFEKTCMS